jgi:aminopeptidase N
MKKLILPLLLLVSELGFAQLMAGKTQGFTRADSLRGTLSPERTCYDVRFYDLNIDVDIAKRYIAGYNTIRFAVLNDFDRMQVDLFDNMNVDRIVWNGKELKYTREFNAVFISFPEQLKAGQTAEIQFFYSGNPVVARNAPWDGGFVFSKDKAGNDWVGVACQGTGASLWWPNKDHQSDEPDSMLITVKVPEGYMEVSNGRLRKQQKEKKTGKTSYTWFVANPINNYDVTLNIAKYAHFSDTYTSADGSGLSLDYYVLPENLTKAKEQFQQVIPMMTAFEKRFGKYPFYEDGYKLVETPYLGMEHQSSVAYGNKYKNGYMGMDLSMTGEGKKFDYIIVHETAHEWWGNSITSADIADMWIHEGFGQYAETVYLEEVYGQESAFKYLNGLKNGVGNKKPVIGPYGVNKEGSGDMYPKGALLLHTLRGVINNDELWWKIIYGISTDFRHQVVTTQQIEDYISSRSGMDLKPVFDQYLRNANIPVLELKFTEKGKDTELEYRWVTDVTSFRMPVEILVGGKRKRITPGNDFQKMTLKDVKKENVQADKSRFYIKEKISE